MLVPETPRFLSINSIGLYFLSLMNWLTTVKSRNCIGCHQLGQESTRTIPAQLGEFKTGEEAWMRRVGSGHTGEFMMNRLAGQLGGPVE